MTEQTYKTHVRFHPLFHFVLVPLCWFLLGATVWSWFRVRNFHNGVSIVAALTLFLLLLLARTYALKVQDRVIRLEETLRLQALGSRTAGLSMRQSVALRFASDEEVVGLAERAARERMTPKQIKEAVRHWRADHHRV